MMWWFRDGEGRSGGEAKVGFAMVVVLTMVWWGGCSDGGGDVDVRRLLAEGGGRRMAVVGEGDGGVEMEMKVSWRWCRGGGCHRRMAVVGEGDGGVEMEMKVSWSYNNMCDEFSKIMHDEFEMSMMGELNFFLGNGRWYFL
ncbi:hypothetical protein Tco_1139763 [Tanacetum coccineum]